MKKKELWALVKDAEQLDKPQLSCALRSKADERRADAARGRRAGVWRDEDKEQKKIQRGRSFWVLKGSDEARRAQ